MLSVVIYRLFDGILFCSLFSFYRRLGEETAGAHARTITIDQKTILSDFFFPLFI